MTRRLFRTMSRGVAVTVLLAVCTGCSYIYDVQFHVGIPAGTTAAVVLEVVDAHGPGDRTLVMPTSNQPVASGTVSVCCAPDPMVTIQAYLDVNNNTVHDAGEPIDVWPGGPVRLGGNRSVQLRLSAHGLPSPSVGGPASPTP